METKNKVPKFEFKVMEDMPQAQRYCSRCRPLGLTAYGKSYDEANANLVRMFAKLVLLNYSDVNK